MKVKEENEKVGLKLNIQKTKIMTSGPITLWQIDGETMETVTEFIFGDSLINTFRVFADMCRLEKILCSLHTSPQLKSNKMMPSC